MESGTIILLIGGSSVYRNNLLSLLSETLDIDYVGEEIASSVREHLKDAILLNYLKTLISVGKQHILWDLPATTFKQRKPIIELAKASNYNAIVFVIDNEDNSCKMEYDDPEYDEDLTHIIYKKEKTNV